MGWLMPGYPASMGLYMRAHTACMMALTGYGTLFEKGQI